MHGKRPASRAPTSTLPALGIEPQADPTDQEDLPPPTAPTKGLTPLQARFANEYIVDLNGTRAYMRARGVEKMPDTTAAAGASILLNTKHVRIEVQRLLDERALVTGITADRVLIRLWEMATADVRELIEHRVGSCRHCWGLYNQYQYTDAEFSQKSDLHIREQADKARKDKEHKAEPFPEKGGPGFDPNRPPNPECPECWGRGKGMPVINDTRQLSPGAAALYEGIKVTKDGMSVQVADRVRLMELVGRHLGMWNDKLKLSAAKPGDDANPLLQLLNHIQQQNAGLPIVHADPEAKPRADVQDVEAKPAAPGAAKGKNTWRAKA